jgi:hypothetical protein
MILFKVLLEFTQIEGRTPRAFQMEMRWNNWFNMINVTENINRFGNRQGISLEFEIII